MGNFLSAPITEKETHRGAVTSKGLKYGVSEMQGWRANMEDAHTIEEDISDRAKDCAFLAVYDGHGGSLAAKYSAEHVYQELASYDGFNGELPPTEIGTFMKKAFLDVDKKLSQLPSVSRGGDHSGCTAIAGFVTKDHIIVANAGDSRSVLAKNGGTVPMSFDHKPNNDIEKNRIEAAGGIVRNRRVNGDLAVSRALGDFIYKGRSDLPAEKQQVSPEPDIKIERITGTEEFLIIACDGIWDVMSNDDINAFIRSLMLKGEKDVGLICEEVIDHCLQLGSRDNMSIVLLIFPGAKFGDGEGVQGLRRERDRINAQNAAAQGPATGVVEQ